MMYSPLDDDCIFFRHLLIMLCKIQLVISIEYCSLYAL